MLQHNYISKHLEGIDVMAQRRNFAKLKQDIITRPTNLELLSGNLIGHIPVNFTTKDMEDIASLYNLDYTLITKNMSKVSGLPHNSMVSHKAENLLLLSIANAILNHKKPDDNYLKDVLFVLIFRVFSSTYSKYFTPLANVNLSKHVYAVLDKSYDIKIHGSNIAVLLNKIDILINRYRKRLKTFKVDDYVNIASAVSGMERSYLKGWYRVRVRLDDSTRIRTDSMLVDGEDGARIAEKEDINQKQYLVAQSVLIRTPHPDVVRLATEVFTRVSPKHFRTYLAHMAKYAESKKSAQEEKLFEQFKKDVIDASINHIIKTSLQPPYHKDMGKLMKYVRNLWVASRVKEERVLASKQYLERLMKGKFSPSTSKLLDITFLCYYYIAVVIEAEKG